MICSIKKIAVALAISVTVLLLSGNEGDGDNDPLSGLVDLEGYIQQARSANPDLKAFSLRYEAAMERIPQASSLPDPMFQVTHFVESVQTRTGPQENVLMLSQRIPWFGKLDSRETMASEEAEALWFAYQNKQLMLARFVSLGYFEYGYTGQAIRLTEENLKLLKELEPIVEEKVRTGGDINSLLRIKVEIGKLDDKLKSLHQKRISQSAKLEELLAVPVTGLLPWSTWEAPEIISMDGASLVPAIEANNPELQMLERKVASAEARREIARLQSYPDVTVGVNYIQIDDPGMSSTFPDAGKDPWGVTASVNIPLWVGKYKAARSEALVSKRASESEYENKFNVLKAELSSSIAKLDDANRRLLLYGDELLGLAEQAVENSRTSYEGGRTSILEVIDSERSLLELQLLYWRAAADAWQQKVIILTLTNQSI